MRLIIASNNDHKIQEIKQILGGHFNCVMGLKEAGYEIDIVENGNSFYENALKKAKEVMQLTGCAALADDSGLCVDALKGAPGIYSARFSGAGATDESNNALLLEKLKNTPAPKWAKYVCAMVLCFPDGPTLSALGDCPGQILNVPMGTNGFGYDPLFMPSGYEVSFGMISDAEKNRISHRFKALQGLLEQLEG